MTHFNSRPLNEEIAPIIAEAGLATIPNLLQETTQSPHGLSNSFVRKLQGPVEVVEY